MESLLSIKTWPRPLFQVNIKYEVSIDSKIESNTHNYKGWNGLESLKAKQTKQITNFKYINALGRWPIILL